MTTTKNQQKPELRMVYIIDSNHWPEQQKQTNKQTNKSKQTNKQKPTKQTNKAYMYWTDTLLIATSHCTC